MTAVSVVIATFNRAPLLREAVESIQQQSFSGPVEIVIVDDGSTDNTADWVRDSNCGAVYRKIGHCGNLAKVRNEGLRLASSEYLLFLDDDDRLHPSAITTLLDAIEDDGSAQFAFGDVDYLSADGLGRPKLADVWDSGRDVFWNLLSGTPLFMQAGLLRASVVRRVGGFNEHCDAAEDYDVCLRISAIAKGIFTSRCVAQIRRQPDSMSVRRALAGTANAARALERIAAEHELSGEHRRALRRNLGKLYRRLTHMFMTSGDAGNARRSALKALSAARLAPRAWARYFGTEVRLLRSRLRLR